MVFLCNLKRFFDAQRVDKVGYSAVRTEKSIIILFMLSLFFAGFLFMASPGFPPFAPLLLIFPVYWAILFVGFKGAATRNPKLLVGFFLSKAFFEIALLSSLSFLFFVAGVITIADAVHEEEMMDEGGADFDLPKDPTFDIPENVDVPEEDEEEDTPEAHASRQFSTPSGTYSDASPDDGPEPVVDPEEDPEVYDPEMDCGDCEDEDEDEIDGFAIVLGLSSLLVLCGAGMLHFFTTLASLVLSMRTFCLIKASAMALPVTTPKKRSKKSKKGKKSKKSTKSKKTTPAKVIPATIPTPAVQATAPPADVPGLSLYPQMPMPMAYMQGGYHPQMVYIAVPPPPQE